jgi:hypothetical protein
MSHIYSSYCHEKGLGRFLIIHKGEGTASLGRYKFLGDVRVRMTPDGEINALFIVETETRVLRKAVKELVQDE